MTLIEKLNSGQVTVSETVHDSTDLGDYVSIYQGKVYYFDRELPMNDVTRHLLELSDSKIESDQIDANNISAWLDRYIEVHECQSDNWENRIEADFSMLMDGGMKCDSDGVWHSPNPDKVDELKAYFETASRMSWWDNCCELIP